MIFTDYVLPIFSLLVSVVSVIVAFKANYISKAAKKISEKSNEIAKDANEIAKKSNDIANESLNFQIIPQIELTKIGLNPTEIKVYGGKNIEWNNKIDLTDDLYQMIKNLALSNILTTIEDKEYILVNLCYSDTPREDIALVLGAFTFEAEYKGSRIAEISVDRVYSLINQTEPFMSDMVLDIRKNIMQPKIKFTLAYACPYTFSSSLNLVNIALLSTKTTDNINLLEFPERVGEIIGFMETSYLIKCTTVFNHEFYYTIHIKRNRSNKMEICQIYNGYEKYKEYCIEATKNANKKIESIAKYNKIKW